ncbi:hypothetical protein [Kordiimonas sp. SCSIO 12610]|uniref:hypothetical protein n=1 Tax=Kordiimonas sp. SCSIO 12610 TaxID=2829597 RepID=UPI00210A8584|nr:hypothetical protein [Kordiimonas sp. SCSIO 12610]UTW54450.1 hypothetical protein KFF44_11605 [Kordiimonas sp. SCSIO 12610]
MIELEEKHEDFFRLWRSLPRDNHPLLPCKKHFTPLTFGNMLSNVAIGEMRGPKNFTFIFSGTNFEAISGFKATGVNYYDILAEKDHAGTVLVHNALFGYPCGIYMENQFISEAGNPYTITSLQLPLCDEKTKKPRFAASYSGGRKSISDASGLRNREITQSSVKNFRYMDIGAGAPKHFISDYKYFSE